MKKIASLSTAAALSLALAGMLGGSLIANAQLFPYSASTTNATSSLSSATTTIMTTNSAPSSSNSLPASLSSASTTSITTTTTVAPVFVTAPPVISSGDIQFNNLVVQSVSSNVIPATIIAASSELETELLMNASSGMATAPQAGPLSGQMTTCESFIDEAATTGIMISCPTAATTSTPYTLEISGTTQLLLSDRTNAVLGNITPGDLVNVFGFYNGDGTIDADIVRDLSKPAGATSVGITTTVNNSGGGTTTTTIAPSAIEAEITQLQALLAQLIQEIDNVMAASSTATTTVSTGAAIPMIPAGATTTITTTTNASGTIIY